MKYGILLGRFSPWHHGHQHILDTIVSDGLEPIVFVGSANQLNARNPYHAAERIHMIHIANPDLHHIYAIDDHDDWDAWFDHLIASILHIGISLDDIVFYLHEKDEDLLDFTFGGVDYVNESYCKIYTLAGFPTVSLPISGIEIRATRIREDLETHRSFLHPQVYHYLLTRQERLCLTTPPR